MRIALTLDRDAARAETNDYIRSLVAAGFAREEIVVLSPDRPASGEVGGGVVGGGSGGGAARYGAPLCVAAPGGGGQRARAPPVSPPPKGGSRARARRLGPRWPAAGTFPPPS